MENIDTIIKSLEALLLDKELTEDQTLKLDALEQKLQATRKRKLGTQTQNLLHIIIETELTIHTDTEPTPRTDTQRTEQTHTSEETPMDSITTKKMTPLQQKTSRA